MAISIGIHNIPSGIALGSLFSVSPIKGLQLAIALILHGIPEGLAVGIFLRESNANTFSLILTSGYGGKCQDYFAFKDMHNTTPLNS